MELASTALIIPHFDAFLLLADAEICLLPILEARPVLRYHCYNPNCPSLT